MESAPTTISPRPSFGAWLIGLGSLGVVAVFAVAVLSAGKILREHSLFGRIGEHLRFKEYSQAEILVEQLASPPLVLQPARLIASEEAWQTRQHDIHIAKVILSVNSALGVNRIDEAQRRLLLFPSGTAEPLIKRTQNGLTALIETAKKLETQQHLVTASEQELDAASQQATLVADEFGELLGLPAIHVAGDDAALPIYEHGVLAGLPRVKGLRDNIADLTFLKVELEGLHAQVKTGGANAHQNFTTRMQELKIAYGEINTKFEEAIGRLEAAQEATQVLGREAATLRTKLQAELAANVLELLEPSML